MKHAGTLLAGVLLMVPAAAHAGVDLDALDEGMTGPRTEMLTLGSVHLSQHKGFNAKALGPLLDKLEAFKPGYITVESISGEQCDLATRHAEIYGEDYCASTEPARLATGLDVPAAIAAVDKVLAAWPAEPTPAQRRHLAALFLAAGEPASAYTQWLQLSSDARRSGDGMEEALVEQLRKMETRNNEVLQIAAVLAARLGLQRVHAVDDHTGDAHRLADRKAFGQAVELAWKADRSGVAALEREQRVLVQREDLLPLYRAVNRPDALRVLADNNVRAALAAASPQHYPQIWVNGWELRNLRMVGNILQVVRDHPGSRVLNIVGASHKPWFDGWLGQMSGVDIVDAQAVLK